MNSDFASSRFVKLTKLETLKKKTLLCSNDLWTSLCGLIILMLNKIWFSVVAGDTVLILIISIANGYKKNCRTLPRAQQQKSTKDIHISNNISEAYPI